MPEEEESRVGRARGTAEPLHELVGRADRLVGRYFTVGIEGRMPVVRVHADGCTVGAVEIHSPNPVFLDQADP